jgi:hypothetical protein
MRHTTIYEQHTPLLITEGILLVTDGGVEGGRGYFGAVLAAGATVIARMRGVARGDPRMMCSFRAEAYGFLAGLHLLANFRKIYPAQDAQRHSIHTDSASLLSRLLTATKAQVPVGFWLKTDSAVVMQIATASKEIPHLQRIYVKGHQDGKKKKADFTQPELYNIDADASVTIMRHEMNSSIFCDLIKRMYNSYQTNFHVFCSFNIYQLLRDDDRQNDQDPQRSGRLFSE